MGLFEHFPYVNFHQANIDWVLERVRYFETQLTAFSSRLTTAEGNISDLQEALRDLDTQLNTLEEALRDLERDLEHQIDALDSRLDTAETDISHLEEQFDRTRSSQIDTDLTAAETDIDTLQDQMAGTENSGLLDMIQNNALPSYTGGDWDRALRIVNLGGGRYGAAWEEPAVVSFATGNITVINATIDHCTAIRSGNTVQIDLEATATAAVATDAAYVIISKYRPIGSAGDLHWYIPVSVSDGSWASNAWEMNATGTEVTGYIYNLTSGDTFNLHLVYITDDPIEQPA